ncbi:hypothetical protein CEXT_47511 [Caerostris extrusa]|uniref:Uncharacterized protein n=1 Tax=Caerostris extrusa TaxID=172846 RepID=A0AAV4VM59_CAEEX|nr:hypothetical protein CEXT_47511 [Caerostris extrusa]
MAFSFPPAEHHANVVCRINEASGKTQKERGVVRGKRVELVGRWEVGKGTNKQSKQTEKKGTFPPKIPADPTICSWCDKWKIFRVLKPSKIPSSFLMSIRHFMRTSFPAEERKRGCEGACHRVFPWLRVNSRDQEDTLGRSSIPPFPLTTLAPGITKSQGKLQLVSKYKQEYLYRGLCVKTPMGWWEGEG